MPVRPRPPITLLRHYRNPWKAAYHHFQRYSDIRVKGESSSDGLPNLRMIELLGYNTGIVFIKIKPYECVFKVYCQFFFLVMIILSRN